MPKIDLITGFLGSGKTTFIRTYAAYLISCGERVGILENDFGAVNVDMMLLSDMESDDCGLEMITGGCCQEPEAHRRRFATKLIAMMMEGYDRVIVEPSGIYEVDEFFDTLLDDSIEGRYTVGNVIALVDAGLEEDLSPEAEYLLASQVSCAGAVLITKSKGASEKKLTGVKEHLNRSLKAVRCQRRLKDEILCTDTDNLTEAELKFLSGCGCRTEHCEKTVFDPEHAFDSLFYMHPKIGSDKIEAAVREIFADEACGRVMRIKGFLKSETCTDKKVGSSWVEINATSSEIEIEPIPRGQEIIIVIGQGLDKEKIGGYLETPQV